MEKMLINQKEINKRKQMKKIQKSSHRRYTRAKSLAKAKIGKFVYLANNEEPKTELLDITQRIGLEMLLDLIKDASMTGMSGNGFSVADKLKSIASYPSEKVLIVNAVECEPTLLHDEWLVNNHWAEISKGIEIVNELFEFKKCYLAYKLLKSERKTKKPSNGFEAIAIAAKYPMGEERLLIKQILGTTLEKDEVPTNKGILVINVQTIFQIYCLITGQYLGGKYITITDIDSGESKVIYTKRGDSIKNSLDTHFPQKENTEYYAGGGAMRSHEVAPDEKFNDTISFAAVGHAIDFSNENSCLGCGVCMRKCPSGVKVKNAVIRKEKNENADISEFGVEKCIECGSCTFFCKAGKNISAYLS